MNLIIRPATLQDVVALGQLMSELGYPTSSEEMTERFKKIYAHPDYYTLVAEVDDQVVGMIGAVFAHRYESNDDYVRIVAMVVRSTHRGLGIGKKLLSAVEQWAKKKEARAIVLNSGNREEREPAHRFYTGQGFKPRSTGYSKSI
ncbi:N-acetyltransferase [Caldalkalibacillus thermarum]|uniref:GNAT family N-acetyltransferase n=1 Tax=Caldalkalibacillus thermarum TaxID=296745 RepID=UPI0019AEAE5A|nr:GNAT family N-acetyltransferase [Caldalkalibacillus thermarum]GGK32200.1 N-acetyltransferase [Caldalkalibacillus thermarum]